ncbi:flagellar hook-length control protein FliK [Shinella zoogloeoides]|uniref:flagellar hook-length control protein FliK n=1 Tax=Shinella zoogloeoides TaxID=352475 RepID=UPI00273E099B|nr:flagellar hook-length control protein FliK [Shinella zoogloeoides]WLR93140.1 flagellar hook-length control protein FliK [Shinella zoogloeoides]
MSTIASGVLGPLQGQAPSKGKAGHGNAGTSEKGDFALTIASLNAKGGEGERKGGRVSISGGAESEEKAEHASDTRASAAHRDLPSLAASLRKTGAAADGDGSASFDEKLASLADAAERPDRKARAEGRESAKAAVLKAGTDEPDAKGEAAADASAPGETDVGNLLELLAAPVVVPHGAVANAAAARVAASGAVQDTKAQGGRASAKADLPGDGATGMKASDLLDAADAGDVPQSDTDKLFRLVRADGKGRDLDMSISGAGDRASLRDANPIGPKGETVTVVDARRYIALAQTGNAAAVTSAITQDPEWTASLSATGGLTHAEAAATGKVVNTLKIQMNPIELGLVTATLRLHGDDLVVSLQVETGEAYRQLRDDQDAIVRALRGQGFSVDQITVQLAPADRGAGTQQGDGQSQQSQQQFSNQPQAREGGNGREQRGGEGAGTFGREGRSHEGNTSDTASGLSGSQSVRSGGVYL